MQFHPPIRIIVIDFCSPNRCQGGVVPETATLNGAVTRIVDSLLIDTSYLTPWCLSNLASEAPMGLVQKVG